MGRDGHEAESVYGKSRSSGFCASRRWGEDRRRLPQARDQQATFYKWKAKYGVLELSDARRLKALEDENAKLKKLLAESMLDNAMLNDIASKKW
jgi:Transposase